MANGDVSFTTKELLSALDSKLDKVLEKLDQKADKASVESLETRMTTMERHGSPALVDIANHSREFEARLALVERTQLERGYLVEEHKGDHIRIESLEAWRNRFAGGIIVIGAIASLNVARIWFGIG